MVLLFERTHKNKANSVVSNSIEAFIIRTVDLIQWFSLVSLDKEHKTDKQIFLNYVPLELQHKKKIQFQLPWIGIIAKLERQCMLLWYSSRWWSWLKAGDTLAGSSMQGPISDIDIPCCHSHFFSHEPLLSHEEQINNYHD